MLNFTFLTKEQISGDTAIDVIKENGTKCYMTDFSCLKGCMKTDKVCNYLTWKMDPDDWEHPGIETERVLDYSEKTGIWGTKTYIEKEDGIYYYVNDEDYRFNSLNVDKCNYIGVRPVIDLSLLSSYLKKDISKFRKIQFGDYPQSRVSHGISYDMNLIIYNNPEKLKKTNNTFGGYNVYSFCGKKYIHYHDYYHDYWIKIEPITWLIDKKANLAVSEKILFVEPYHDCYNCYKKSDGGNDDFEHSNINHYLNEIFAKEIVQFKTPSFTLLSSNKFDETKNLDSFLNSLKDNLNKKYTKLKVQKTTEENEVNKDIEYKEEVEKNIEEQEPSYNKKTNETLTKEIEELINKIMSYINAYKGDIDIEKEVTKLTDNYNKKINEYTKKMGSEEIYLTLDSPEGLLIELYNELTKLLQNIELSNKVSDYEININDRKVI